MIGGGQLQCWEMCALSEVSELHSFHCSCRGAALAPLMLMEQHQRVPGVAPHLSLSADSLHLGSYQCKYLVRSIAKVDAMIL